MADLSSSLPAGCGSPLVLVPSSKSNGDHLPNVPTCASGPAKTPQSKEGNISLSKSYEEPEKESAESPIFWCYQPQPYRYQPPKNPFSVIEDSMMKWVDTDCPLEWLIDDDVVDEWVSWSEEIDED